MVNVFIGFGEIKRSCVVSRGKESILFGEVERS